MQSQLFITSHPTNLKKIAHFLEKEFKFKILNNPDVTEINRVGENLKIKAIRQLKNDLLYPPLKENKRFFILYDFQKTILSAQNALLKSLEEPPAYAQIILICSNLKPILPTIKSRCVIKMLPNENRDEVENKDLEQIAQIYKQIINGSAADKIELTRQYKTQAEATQLLEGLLRVLHQQNTLKPNEATTQNLQILDDHLVYLNQNINLTLTLENCFFAMKQTYPVL